MTHKKKFDWEKMVYFSVLSTMALSAIYIIVIMVLAPASIEEALPFDRVKSDYILMLLQCLLGIFAMFLPSILKHRWRVAIPSKMIIAYALFLYCAIYLGEVRSFYYLVPHWDIILHTSSGAMLGALGFSVVNLLNKSDTIHMKLSPLFVAAFSFNFAISLGVIWEVYEFFMDIVFGTNMQKFMLEGGKMLIGQAALSDTMSDLIVDTIGAAVISILGYISLKYRKGWIEKTQISVDRDSEDKNAIEN